MERPELSQAAAAGDLATIRSLLDAGADIRYRRAKGYTVIIDVMYGREIAADAQLLPILRLLVERGADLDAVSEYGESALGVASRVGRFDAVGLLLGSGADPAPLGWTALHRAVALGTAADVGRRLEAGDDPAARDRWGRTALLLGLHAGDLAKVELLLSAGGSLDDRGRCGKTPLQYPVENDDPALLRWLLDRGTDPDATDEFGDSALIAAAEHGATRCVRVLLDAGADPNRRGHTQSPMRSAANLEIARMLAEAGADLAEINDAVRDELTGRRRTDSIGCTPEEYRAARHRAFGTANPQPMDFPFWRAMVAAGQSAYQARATFDEGNFGDAAVWCFDRYGKSFTELPGGRVVEIGGEHEDSYDSDFCIYNDVVVHHGDGMLDIYGYPEGVFPPTDFHTATLQGDRVIIIGRLGYRGQRRFGTTPVLELDLADYRIRELPSHGELPGWIFEHEARLGAAGIVVRGGKVADLIDGAEGIRQNFDDFLYDPSTGAWTQLTDRRWRQVSISDAAGRPFMRGRPLPAGPDAEGWADNLVYVAPEAVRPRHIAYEGIPSAGHGLDDRIIVDGVEVRIAIEPFAVEILIAGEIEAARADALIADIRGSIEADTNRPCVVTIHPGPRDSGSAPAS